MQAAMDGDDACFIRTEDVVCLMCTSGDSTKRGFLAAEGFGSLVCHLEPEPRNQEPCELQKCTFKVEDAMSVHAMYSSGLATSKQSSSCKILMYGHAVLLRHLGTKELLSSLSTSPENDKMAYDVGFDLDASVSTKESYMQESCWFRILPASNQRSEGEKVRAGDDIFLVNVENERYLFAQMSSDQNAESEKYASKHQSAVRVSFHPCVWSLHIVCSGSAKEAAIGNVNGGDVVRFIHRYWGGGDIMMVRKRRGAHKVTESVPDNTHIDVQYEKPENNNHELRSLWRVELSQMKFGGGFTSWGQPFRLRHLISGKFLGVKKSEVSETDKASSVGERRGSIIGRSKKVKYRVALLSPSEASWSEGAWGEASWNATAFCFVNSAMQAKQQSNKNNLNHVPGMGTPEIHFGDSDVYLYHISSGCFLGFAVSEQQRHRTASEPHKAIMQPEFNQSFAFTMTRASCEQAKAANIVQLSESVMRNYVHKDLLNKDPSAGGHLQKNLSNILTALIQYFRSPDKLQLSHDQYQRELCQLRERQNLFKKQGMLKFTLTVIVETANKLSSKRVKILHSLYQLLAAMIRGNHDNCCEFATQKFLGVFMKQLSVPTVTHQVLTVIQCLLADSPEVLNIFSQADIGVIVNLLNTNGRDSEVMKLLSSLCVCHGVAMRDKQQLIYKHLLNCSELLVQTSQHPKVHCLHPDLYVGVQSGCAAYKKWYYEVQVTAYDTPYGHTPHLKMGWAHATQFRPHPCSTGSCTLDGGIGDDVYSLSFDGTHLWTGGVSVLTQEEEEKKEDCCKVTSSIKCPLRRQEEVIASPCMSPSQSSCGRDTPFSVGDVIGCYMNLETEEAWFARNGRRMSGCLKFKDYNDMLTPAISFSAGVNFVLSLGGSLGGFAHPPPPEYAGLHEAADPSRTITLTPFRCLGERLDILVTGPPVMSDFESFVPAPIDTSKISLPDSIASVNGSIRDMLAKNIHEVWSKNKIEAGYTYAKVRDDTLKHHPMLMPFDQLDPGDQAYDYDMALKTLKTLVALGYQLSTDEVEPEGVNFVQLPEDRYRMSNGYIPSPLNLESVSMPGNLESLVEKLAENAHNIWAAGRIKQGWTFGIANDAHAKRNSMLVPYSKLSAAAKKSNRDTAHEAVRTVCALGCHIIPPMLGGEGNINQLMREFSESGSRTRTFRGQKCYKVLDGKWYYEVRLLTEGMMRVGWVTPSFQAGSLLGSDSHSYAYDGHLSRKWHQESENFGRRWHAGDVVSCLLDMEERTISFALNGELLYDLEDSSVTFENIDTSDGFMPAITLSGGERALINFGHSTEELKYYHLFEGQGYVPLCSPRALQYNIPLWYSSHGGFLPLNNKSRKFKLDCGCNTLAVLCRDWDYSLQPDQDCFRLNMGCTVSCSKSSPPPTLTPRPGPLSPLLEAEPSSLDDLLTQEMSAVPVSFSVVFPMGQSPCVAYVGWTTPSFRYSECQFWPPEDDGVFLDQHSHGTDYGQFMELSGDVGGSVRCRTAFMVCLCDLLPSYAQQLTSPVRVNCTLNLSTGKLVFTCDAQSSSHYQQTSDEPPVKEKKISFTAPDKTKLFPTVVITPMAENVMEFDFAPVENCRTLSSCFLRATPTPTPSSPPSVEDSILGPVVNPPKVLCRPPRMKLMLYSKSLWTRQSTEPLNYSTDISGPLEVLTREIKYDICVTLPQEDVVMDIREIAEDLELMNFHVHTLKAFCAVCSHSNMLIAKSIVKYINSEQLLKCLHVGGLRFELSAVYLKLLTSLHLDHHVQTRLLMRGEFVLPRSECTTSVPLFKTGTKSSTPASSQSGFSLRRAPLPGSALLASNIQHNITSSFSQTVYDHNIVDFSIDELKELVLRSLEKLLHSDYYKMYLLPADSRSPVFVPMIEALDHLLVMGVLNQKEDLQRLLHLLDPGKFSHVDNGMHFDEGLLCQEVSNEEPMKLALCVLLQHLCDCQIRHRVEAVVSFSNDYVQKLQDEQQERYKKNITKKPKEFRSSSEIQVEGMLAFKSDYSCSKALHEKLQQFTAELKLHCGKVGDTPHDGHEPSSWEKLKKLVKLVSSFEDLGYEFGVKGHCHTLSLQHIITQTMLSWASKEIHDLKLIEEIFSLLYRQFNEVGEVVQALKKTYVLEVTKDKSGKPNFDIQGFCDALGSLRLLLKVGMSKKEENLLRSSLKTIHHSNLFYCHPSLLLKLEVHSTVLKLMKSYLGISSGTVRERFLASKRKLKLDLIIENGPPLPVEKCCRFLCKFAKINQENQRALFKHIAYLLEHAEKYPGLLSCDGYTPLDVATATIRDNRELALALEASHLEHVIQLLLSTTTGMGTIDSADSVDDTPNFKRPGSLTQLQGTSFATSLDWNPNGGGKCLDFLQSAVWVENEQIQENAYIIVQQLIHHTDCMGPALAGDALGLSVIYRDTLQRAESLAEERASFGRFLSMESVASKQEASTEVCGDSSVLSFYTTLMRLLAYCASVPCDRTTACLDEAGSNSASRHKQSAICRTRSILQNLIKAEEIVTILSFKSCTGKERGLSAYHKEAALLFLDRVYGMPCLDLLLQLLNNSFIPDVKLALQLSQEDGSDPRFSASLSRYVCCSIFPLLSRHASIFKQLKTQLYVVDNFLLCCFRLFNSSNFSSVQLDRVSAFFIAVLKELHPKTIQRFMPKILTSLPNIQSHTIVACRLLSSHYDHFARYYQSVGALDKTSLGIPSEEEKTCAALVVYRLLDSLAKKLPTCPHLLRAAVSCLKSVSRALSPSSLIPSQYRLSCMYLTSGMNYEPQPVDTSRIVLNTNLKKFISEFADYQHACWVFGKQSDGWVYGPQKDDTRRHHPNLRPYKSLDKPDQEKYRKPIEEAVSFLMVKGWSFNKVRPMDTHSIPLQQKMVCIRRTFKRGTLQKELTLDERYYSYEPEVLDLTKVEIKLDLLALAERMAEYSHDSWAKHLMSSDTDYRSHPDFLPYEIIDEAKKEELRTSSRDLLRYMRVAGFEPAKMRASMHYMLNEQDSITDHKKFSLQLFEKFLEYLSQPNMEVDFYLKVLFPVLTGYLSKHSGYFMPSSDMQASSTTASSEEKVSILLLFCKVTAFIRKKLDMLFPSVKNPSSKVLSPGSGTDDHGGKLFDFDSSWAAAKCINSLLRSVVLSMDMKSIAGDCGCVSKNCSEIVDFFRQATTGINLTAKNISRMDTLDSQFHFYCLQVLIPSLTALFKHVGWHKTGHLLIDGPVQNHCRYIFTNLVEMAMGTGPVYVGSSPLVALGQCMGAFALAYPQPFLHDTQFGFNMSSLIHQLHNATLEGTTGGNVLFVVDIIIPVLASYICRWWNTEDLFALSPTPEDLPVTRIDEILTCVMTLMATHFGEKRVKWFSRVVESSIQLATKCSLAILGTHVVPMLTEMRERAVGLWGQEYQLSSSWNTQSKSYQEEGRYEAQETLLEVLDQYYQIFLKDFTSLLPFLSVFLHCKSEELRHLCSQPASNPDICDQVLTLFQSLSDLFHCWSSSQCFKREYQTCLHQFSYQVKCIMGAEKMKSTDYFNAHTPFRRQTTGQRALAERQTNYILVCLELLVPVVEKLINREDRPLLDNCCLKLGTKGVTPSDLMAELIAKFEARERRSQKLTRKLVRSLSNRFTSAPADNNQTHSERAAQILNLAKIKHKIQQSDKGRVAQKRWKHLFSRRKKKAVIKCFLAVPFFKFRKHSAINLFIHVYCREWLGDSEQTTHQRLTEELLDHQDYLALQRIRDNDKKPRHEQKQLAELKMDLVIDPLSQFFKMMQRLGTTGDIINEHLYTSYASVLERNIMKQHEEEMQNEEDDPTGAYEVYTERKARLISKQAQLADRGAPTTVIDIITAADGEKSPVLHSTLLLGIALLTEGNSRIQSEMLHELNTVDVGFLQSISKLISKCSVLDWNAYERFNKSDTIQSTHIETMCKVLPDYHLAISLFHFLQLLCEGHNLHFQNYLRTQAGNTTTVNIIVCTVDYLLRLQESISDFYWHYSDYQTIDLSGRENFLKAFKVAKQVFRTLTEYIQGPCVKNQDTLAHSRLWDAVSGFIHIFAVLQRKLYRETSQLELLRELLGLQEEMFILLLSMLEGSAMSSTVGKLMLDMLTESIHHIEDIMAFFVIFIKLKDSATSKAFKEYDLNKDGFISYREFEKAMEAQQRYTKDEIAYLMECADLNKDGLLDYLEFTERFHQPAENIGFHLCVLIVHLTDHLPNNKRVERLKRAAQSKELLEHFEKNMGCIEIQGKSGRIERVYFEVKATRVKQWDEAQIQVSRRFFLHSVEMGSQKNKLLGFMTFCDETIFEMNYSDKISGSVQTAMKERAVKHRSQHNRTLQHHPQPVLSRVKANLNAIQDNNSCNKLLGCLQVIWLFLLLSVWPYVKTGLQYVWTKLTALSLSVKTRFQQLIRLRPHQLAPPPTITTTTSLPPPSGSPSSCKKPVKRPPSLHINISPPQPASLRHRATSAISQAPGLFPYKRQKRPSDPQVSPMDEGGWKNGAGGPKRASLGVFSESMQHVSSAHHPEYSRGVSVGTEEMKGSHSYTQRNFKPASLSLTYNRSRMKRPSVSPTGGGTTPSPMAEEPEVKSVRRDDSYIPKIAAHTRGWSSYLARNYFQFHNLKLCVTLLINIILLTYQVQPFSEEFTAPSPDENISIDLYDPFWTPSMLSVFALMHFLLSALLIVSYFYLQIPLVIFKREKRIARELEMNQLWVTSKPLETWQDWWDQIVVGARTFPRNYWDKQVKRRVYEGVVTSDRTAVARVLGMEVKSKFERRTRIEQAMEIVHSLIDIRYCIWTVGVTLSNPVSLYHLLYCMLSFVGLRWNSFYFSIHLLDFVMNFKLLRTVLKSVLHNGKQLAMTFLMTCVIIYIYTVIAFNFLRKFYQIETPGGDKVFKCNSMLQCFVFHIDQGMRSGGGIADVLESASGDPYEPLRLLFDFTFFFIVVIILLAIIQGLIIDAFGELRDKEDTLTNEMQTKCFVCGLPKSEFDHIPHGFDNHLRREHNMAHYMFFLMYLIKKKESEFSGQESYVWEKYLQQSVDFFPVGDCFQSQEERTMAATATSLAAAEGRSLLGNQHKKSGHDQQKPSPLKKSQTMFL